MRLSRKGRQRLENKRKKKKELNKLVVASGLVSMTLVIPFIANATTVEDIRELVGKQKISDLYTQQEIKNIKIGYKRIESFNNIVDMFELLKDVDRDIILMTRKERASLISKINIKKYELENTFSYGGSVNDILKVKSELDNMIFKESLLKKENEVIELKKQKNIYQKDYNKLLNIEKELDSYKDLGMLPHDIGFPVVNSNFLVGAYGIYVKNGVKYFNNGIDIFGVNNSQVINMFNGVVEKIYKIEDNVYRVVIKNDKSLKTVYEAKMLLDENIKEGKIIKQKQAVGKLLETDKGYGYLHFEVYLDNNSVNPIYLFGKMGKNALKVYQSVVEDEYFNDYSYIIERIKEIDSNEETKGKIESKLQKSNRSGVIDSYLSRFYDPPNPKSFIEDE